MLTSSVSNFFLGIALSGNSGLRATVPLFLTSVMALTNNVTLSSDMNWVASPVFAGLSGALMVLEIIADKIPGIDHILHAVMSFIHPMAGAVASIAPDYGGGWYTRVPVAVVGAALALVLFIGRALLRLISSGGTMGACNPVVSCFEDVIVFVLVPLCILLAFFSVIVAVGFVLAAGSILYEKYVNPPAPLKEEEVPRPILVDSYHPPPSAPPPDARIV